MFSLRRISPHHGYHLLHITIRADGSGRHHEPPCTTCMVHGDGAVMCMHDVGVRYCMVLYGAMLEAVSLSIACAGRRAAEEGCLLIADVICEVPAKEMTILASIITITSTTSTSIYLPPPTHLHPHTLVLTIDHGLRIHNPCHTHISKHSVVLLQLKLL